MTQKLMLRAEVYARAMGASEISKRRCVERRERSTPNPSRVEAPHEINFGTELSRFRVYFCELALASRRARFGL